MFNKNIMIDINLTVIKLQDLDLMVIDVIQKLVSRSMVCSTDSRVQTVLVIKMKLLTQVGTKLSRLQPKQLFVFGPSFRLQVC